MAGKKSLLPSTGSLQRGLYVLGIVALLGLVYVGLGGQVPQFFASTPGAGASQGISTAQGTLCSVQDKTGATPQYLAQYLDQGTNTWTPVATTVVGYQGTGNNVEAAATISFTSSASGYSSSNTTLDCGLPITSYVGDGGTNYYYQKIETASDKMSVLYPKISAKLKKSQTASVTFQNSTSGSWASTVAQGGVSSGQTGFNAVTMKVKAGQYYYGDGAFEVCAQYTTSNISKVSFGSDAVSLSTADKSLAVAAGTNTDCYEVVADLYNSGEKTLPVVIDAASGVTPSNTTIRIFVNDATFRIKNGQPTDKYYNSDTKADLGIAAINTASAITVNP